VITARYFELCIWLKTPLLMGSCMMRSSHHLLLPEWANCECFPLLLMFWIEVSRLRYTSVWFISLE